MGPCCQTKWCKIPECCGIIAGRDSIFQMEYIASRYVRIGNFSGDVGGICIQEQNPQNGTRCNLTVPFPVHVQVPQYLANYPSNLCNISVCPQYESETYNITVPFRFATTVLTSSVKIHWFNLYHDGRSQIWFLDRVGKFCGCCLWWISQNASLLGTMGATCQWRSAEQRK